MKRLIELTDTSSTSETTTLISSRTFEGDFVLFKGVCHFLIRLPISQSENLLPEFRQLWFGESSQLFVHFPTRSTHVECIQSTRYFFSVVFSRRFESNVLHDAESVAVIGEIA